MLGNFLVPYCSEVHHARTLESMGHTVVRIQEGQVPTGRIVREALQSQLFVWVHTHSWRNQGNISMPDILEALRRRNVPAIAYHLDAFCGIPSRWETYKRDEYITGGLSHWFTVDAALADWLNEHPVIKTKGVYLPAGVLEAECYLARPTRPLAEVAFVGSYRYHPEHPHRQKLIDWLRKTYRDRFSLYGQDAGKVIRGAELNQLYADTKIVVGDSFKVSYPYFSDRAFETLGRGGMLIHPRALGMEAIFKDREHLAYYDYDDFDQLKGLIDHYLADDTAREKIRLAGHEHVRAHHTYTVRWKHILDTVAH